MYEISAKFSISSAHFLCNYEGKCKNLHGHNWSITVFVKGDELDSLGMLVDFNTLKKYFKIIENELDHTCLNELDYFKQRNPTAENISEYIYNRMSELFRGDEIGNAEISKVSVYETQNCEAIYYK